MRTILSIFLLLFTNYAFAGPQYPIPVSKGGTGAKTFGSGQLISGNTTNPISSAPALNALSGNIGLGIQGPVGGTYGTGLITFTNPASSGKYNWLIGGQYHLSNAFELTPSTAVDGSTFTTPVFLVDNTGVIYVGGSSATKISNNSGVLDFGASIEVEGGIYLANESGAYLSNAGGNSVYVSKSGGSSFPANVSAGGPAGDLTVRGYYPGGGSSCGTVVSEAGVSSCVRNSTGNYTINFTNTYSGYPSCNCNNVTTTYCCSIPSLNPGNFTLQIYQCGPGTAEDSYFSFQCSGTRGSY